MPLKKPEHYGTDAGGIPSEIYCIYCWQNGSFTDHCTDVKEFQEHCRTQMVKHGWSKFFAWLFTRGMKRLGRWKNTKQ